ncbi:hypothetical protein HN784_02510 [bacterium]|jgi:hypothetical protein|nr:hypothetical protein [bacterium]MBT4250862.1 hypothetical protein [bacterium]MBT4597575.1 hypothetical protein [bacterium]MBT6754040.1 hypothetical protein [bacterium]MBT7038070.1 hypothetical protein [bacterium]
MAELILEAKEAASEWFKGKTKDKTLIQLAIAFAMLALDSEEHEVRGILKTLIETLKRFKTKGAEKMIKAVTEEMEMHWTNKPASNKPFLLL